MKEILKAFSIAVAIMILSSCASTPVNLNKAIVGTECKTREECLKDLNLPNPENPDKIFILEKKDVIGTSKTWAGIDALVKTGSNADYNFFLDICIAKALTEKIKKSKIVIGAPANTNDIYIYDISEFYIKAGLYYSAVTKFKAKVKRGNEITTIEANGNSETMWGDTAKYADKSTLNACRDFADKTNKLLNPSIKTDK